ncbi:hypothetical protein Acr_00g0045650 [Actinidia rufa]|uniref:Uncharacterized protein n=1 Tax=Actinidia rufa TaxID=165716 RepID=A0A7J0DL26_9ERIC|nr:hypothetical protein Acr_00g0045650 [Actinidia rufa]
MKFYISESGIKRVTISSAVASGGNGGGGRRLSHRTVLLAVLMLAIILPFLFVRIAFVVLESSTVCSSSLECMRWRFFGEGDSFPVSVLIQFT